MILYAAPRTGINNVKVGFILNNFKVFFELCFFLRCHIRVRPVKYWVVSWAEWIHTAYCGMYERTTFKNGVLNEFSAILFAKAMPYLNFSTLHLIVCPLSSPTRASKALYVFQLIFNAFSSEKQPK